MRLAQLSTAGQHPQSTPSVNTYFLVIDSFTRDNVFMFAGRVIFVVDLPLPQGHVTEAAAPEGDPAAGAVLPHHDLGPDPDQVVTTENSQSVLFNFRALGQFLLASHRHCLIKVIRKISYC